MESFPRVVGSPQQKPLFGAKSREQLTSQENRRSGQWRLPSPPPEPPLPKVIYVPLPPPALQQQGDVDAMEPRVSTEDAWAQRLNTVSNQARAQCGLPLWSPGLSQPKQPWPGTVPAERTSEQTETTQSSDSYVSTSERRSADGKTSWLRRLASLCCLGRR